MIDVSIKLRSTPGGFTRASVTVMGSDTDRPKVFNSLHPSRDGALDEALLLARAEIEEMGE